MYPVSSAFLNAVKANNRKYYWTGKITTTAGTVYNFDQEDMVKGSGYITNVHKQPRTDTMLCFRPMIPEIIHIILFVSQYLTIKEALGLQIRSALWQKSMKTDIISS